MKKITLFLCVLNGFLSLESMPSTFQQQHLPLVITAGSESPTLMLEGLEQLIDYYVLNFQTFPQSNSGELWQDICHQLNQYVPMCDYLGRNILHLVIEARTLRSNNQALIAFMSHLCATFPHLVNLPDRYKTSPLHLAASTQNILAFCLLLKYGAVSSISVPDCTGKTPIDLALRANPVANPFDPSHLITCVDIFYNSISQGLPFLELFILRYQLLATSTPLQARPLEN